MISFPDRICTVMGKALSVQLDRQHLLSSNIANADTPGFVPVDLDFPAALRQELQDGRLSATDEHHLPAAAAEGPDATLFYDPSVVPGLDGNAVSLDNEMTKMAENTVLYNATARALQKKLGLLRYAINEGGAS
jgi:flagellar basal-body rod protein FlgB